MYAFVCLGVRVTNLIQGNQTRRHGFVGLWVRFMRRVGNTKSITQERKKKKTITSCPHLFSENYGKLPHGFSTVLPLLVEEDLLKNTHLPIPLGELFCAVGPRDDQAPGQRQRPRGRPRNPLFHRVVGETTGHLERLPVHH